ncbi:MAG TPA: hypothetical protein DIC60_10870 [Lachnospiraceae bacterium]|nr:hypothetical protein [Lachnospiraceae bacterium]
MRKRILSIMLTLCMVLSLLPQTALAEEEVSYTYGGEITTTGLDLSTAPSENKVYKAGDGVVLWQPGANKVLMRDATIDTTTTTSSAFALTLKNDEDVTIVADGENVFKSNTNGIGQKSGDYPPSFYNANTVIEGSGTLEVTTTDTSPWYSAIDLSYGALEISGEVTVTPLCEGGMGRIVSPYGLSILDNASVTSPSRIYINTAFGNVNIDTAGTVTEFYTMSNENLNYTNGDLKGAWVWKVNNDGGTHRVSYVHGSYTITENQTITDASGDDGLTIMQGATLTINEGVTLTINDDAENGIPQITNNGTVVNNGTIQFQTTATDDTILALTDNGTLTGSGVVKRGDTEVAPINGVVYEVVSNVSTTGLDLFTTTPTENTCYKAGSGYILWQPTVDGGVVKSGTVTLKNASINTANKALNLPGTTTSAVDITIVVEGENSLISADNHAIYHVNGETLIQGSGTLNAQSQGSALSKAGIYQPNGAITITGDVMVNATGGDNGFGICSEAQEISILGNASVTATGGYDGIWAGGNITINTSGTVNVPKLTSIQYVNYTSGTITGSWVYEGKDDEAVNHVNTVYGSMVLTANKTMEESDGEDGLTIMQGASLTINEGVTFTIEDDPEAEGIPKVTNNGTLVNNGTIVLPSGTTAEEVKATAANLKATGSGVIAVYGDETMDCYTNSGEPINWVNDINLGETETFGDGYTWVGNTTDGFTLTLDSVYVNAGDITLPSNVPVTIALEGNSMANEGIAFTGGYPCDLTFAGSGTFILNGGISGTGCNGDMVTVQGGATVNVGGGISIGASGGQDGTLIVDGTETDLAVSSQMGAGVYLDTVRVTNGGQMTVHAASEGIFAGDGGVTVTGGSTLNVGCDYGVYIIDGKLTIDKTSKLITNGAIAPFCVVDKTKSKAQSDAVSLPGVPSGTKITSVQGELGNYWSLVNTGNTLGVTDENSEPVTLSGAVKGIVTFAAAKTSSSDGGGSETYHIITATAKTNGSISPSGNVNVVSDGSKTFTITADEGYAVKDVLVDGVSVGAVATYTFDKVSKAHTITASFEEIHWDVDSLYNDVKDSDWFKTAVDYVTEKGLMAGTGDGEFGPYISTDRGMIVTIFWRLEGEPSATAKSSFTDVAEGEYYTDAVAWAAENKIVEGYGNGIFGPKDTITREQMAAILYRYSKFKNYDTTQGGMAVREFSDYGKISDWALESVGWAVNSDLLSGVGYSQLDPCGFATRAQVASILMRYCEKIVK